MDIKTFIEIFGIFIVVVSNFVIFVIFFSRLAHRVEVTEKELTRLQKQDERHEAELKEFRDLNSKLDMIIKHFIPSSGSCSAKNCK